MLYHQQVLPLSPSLRRFHPPSIIFSMLYSTKTLTLIAASASAGVALAGSQCNVPIDHPRSPSFDLGANLLSTKHELSYSTLTPPSLTRSVYVFGACGRGIGHDGTLEDREQVRCSCCIAGRLRDSPGNARDPRCVFGPRLTPR